MNAPLETTRPPISYAARVAARRFKREVNEREEVIKDALRDESWRDILADYMYKKGKGRARALAKLKNTMPAKIELVKDKPRVMMWSLLTCSTHLIKDPIRPGEGQAGIITQFIVASMPNRNRFTLDTGAWTLEIPDHAIGRLFERCPKVDAHNAIYQTHYEVLRTKTFKPSYRTESVYMPTTGGLWAGHMIWSGTKVAQDEDTSEMEDFLARRSRHHGNNEILVFYRARTYLSDGMTTPNQNFPDVGSPCFGESFMLPWPLRTLKPDENETGGLKVISKL